MLVVYQPSSPGNRSGTSPAIVTNVCETSGDKDNGDLKCEERKREKSLGKLIIDRTKRGTTEDKTWKHWLKDPGFYKVVIGKKRKGRREEKKEEKREEGGEKKRRKREEKREERKQRRQEKRGVEKEEERRDGGEGRGGDEKKERHLLL